MKALGLQYGEWLRGRCKVCGFAAGGKLKETADRNTPLRPVAIETWSLVMTQDGADRRAMAGVLGRELRRETSAHQKSAYGDESQHSVEPTHSTLAAAAIAIRQHMPHPCE